MGLKYGYAGKGFGGMRPIFAAPDPVGRGGPSAPPEPGRRAKRPAASVTVTRTQLQRSPP